MTQRVPNAHPGSARDAVTRRWERVAVWVGLVLVTWIAFIEFPRLPPLGLDPSWRMALSYFTNTDLQFGRDVVFTAGPLGYLLSSSATGMNYGHHLVWQLGANLFFAAGVVALARNLKGARAIAYYLFFWGIAPGYVDTLQMILLLCGAFCLFEDHLVRRRWFVVLIAVILAAFALIKFTNFLLALTSVGAAVGWLVWLRRWRDASWVAAAFIVSFAVGWLAWGQSLLNLPAFLFNGLNVSSGYLDSMGVVESPAMFHAGISALLALGAYWILVAIRLPDWRRGVAVAVVGMAGSFLSWKHGFVRADGHVFAFFYLCLFFVVSHGCWTKLTARLSKMHAVVLTIIALAALRGVALQDPVKVTNIGEFINHRIRDNGILLLDVANLEADARGQFALMQRQLRLPTAQALSGTQKRVDLLGCDVGYAVVNGFNYRPRPTIQGYVAMTPHLAELNAAFMADEDRAPQVVLYRIETIDNRLPTLDDAQAIRYLLHHYDFVSEEGGFMIWTRRDSDPALDSRELISEQTVAFGETISTPQREDQPIWCEMEIRLTVKGRLRRFFYKPPSTYIRTDDGGFDQRTFLLPPPMAEAGFPTYPYFTNHTNVLNYQAGGPAPRLMRFAVEVDPDLADCFETELSVRFYALPPYPRLGHDKPMPKEVLFRAFNRVPDKATGPVEAGLIDDGQHIRLLVHTPSALSFELEGTERTASGVFGLLPNAYIDGNNSDGASFAVEWVPVAGTARELWRREINPRDQPDDRGDLTFAVELPPEKGQLRFVTGPGPAGDRSFDWVYWAEVAIE